MEDMLVAQVHLLFSFVDEDSNDGEMVPCALVVSWFIMDSGECDCDTGMWMVKPEGTQRDRPVQVIPLKSIARGAHLLPKYGIGFLPDYITYINALSEFQVYIRKTTHYLILLNFTLFVLFHLTNLYLLKTIVQ